jgi:hypothetical protein
VSSTSNNQTISLKALQESFYESIFNPQNTTNLTHLGQQIQHNDSPLTPEDRITIYRNSILGGITDALAAIYSVCVKLVGDEFFTHMVSGYLKQYPSGSPDLGNYGEFLPEYIEGFKPAKELAYLPDVARLEWLWHKAFNAPELKYLTDKPSEISELAHIPEEKQGLIQFCVDPSASLMNSDYPVHRIWEVNQDDYNGTETVNLDDGSSKLLVWRCPNYGMRIDMLNESEFTFLSALQQNKTFIEIAELQLEESINDILPRCIQTGLISGFHLPEPSTNHA